jgi:hypothetical protein
MLIDKAGLKNLVKLFVPRFAFVMKAIAENIL